ncbi:hypothetical protein [Actinomadura alba]|uniref:PASTA domain-containing protein n=1 Tax=Actinomadura alba TaxID=406431 RepID=A0ABR7LPL9_9ACTN|nr:hypothetical protein [Actinomadura alba]MBC6466790.1 hypothetical protein [Actinomadura alba]
MNELKRMYADVPPPDDRAVTEGRARLLAAADGTGATAASARPRRALHHRPRFVAGAVGVAALGTAVAIAVTAPGGAEGPASPTAKAPESKGTMRLAAAVQIDRKSDYYAAMIVDPTADKKRLSEAFAQRGFDIQLSLVPVSPSVVGTIVYQEESEGPDQGKLKVITDPSCRTASRAACPVGLRIPHGFKGRSSVVIGRAAAPGEEYVSTNPADAPKGIEGKTVTQAEAALARKGLKVGFYNVYWKNPGYGIQAPRSKVNGGWNVSGVEPFSPGTVMLMIDGAGPVPPEVVKKAQEEKTAVPAATRTP